MECKVIFTDAGKDKAIIGLILKEDDFFIEVLSHGRNYRIGKRSVVCIKESKESEENERCNNS